MKRLIYGVFAIIVIVFGLLWSVGGGYGLHVLMGGKGWPEMGRHDIRLSPSMRKALKLPLPIVTSGVLKWTSLAPGFEVADLPVMAGKDEVDRFHLVRIDPARYRFSVHNAPSGPNIRDWKKRLPDAALIVNGSFFGPGWTPDTPFLSDGKLLGPQVYDARGGAFVAGETAASVIDLSDGRGWQKAFSGASNAMVAYPLLIGADGKSHVTQKSEWLANRTFVGQDQNGGIIVGTTKEAFFSLDREAAFLIASPLDLKVALNLDGGPVACQSVRAGGTHRHFIAHWEAQVKGNQVRLLNQPPFTSSYMPVVLVATPKTQNQPKSRPVAVS